MKRRKLWEPLRKSLSVGFVAVFILLWIGGVHSYFRPAGPPPAAAWAGPAFLWIAALLTLLGARSPKMAGFLLFLGAAGFGAEVLGVHTGFPFGGYEYSPALGARWLSVPLTLAAAWSLLGGYVADRTRGIGGSRLIRTGIGAVWLTGIDLLLDPLAAGPLGYWRWTEGGAFYGIPATNFAGWFLVSFLLLSAAPRDASLRPPTRWVGRGVIAFFSLLALGFRLWGPAAAGFFCLAADVMIPAIFMPSRASSR